MRHVLFLVICSALLSQGMKGKVSFLLGKATYQVEGTKSWKAIKLDATVFQNWVVKTQDGAELEISWENGTTSEISSNEKIALKSLIKDTKVELSWFERMKNKLQVLFTRSSSSKVKDVAGIRQSEVVIAQKDSLYWESLPKTDFNEAYAHYINNEWNKAKDLFEQVVFENPLHKNAEISRSCLIIIYSEQGNKEKATEHLSHFINDFPDSDLKSLIEEAKNKTLGDHMKKLYTAILIVISVFCLSWLTSKVPVVERFLNQLDLLIYDYSLRMKLVDTSKKKINDIIIVDIDEKSIAELGKFSNWPRAYFADAINYLNQSNAKQIAFDMFFTEPEARSSRISDIYVSQMKKHFGEALNYSTIINSLDTDPILADALKKSNKVILGAFDNFNSDQIKKIKLSNKLTSFPNDQNISFKTLVSPMIPIPSLTESAYKVGFAHIYPDNDGVIRHYPLFFNYYDKLYLNFSMQMVLDHYTVDSVSFSENYSYLYSKDELQLKIPIDSIGQTKLNFYGSGKTFRYISFSDLLDKRIDSSFFRDKYILFGTSAIGLYDLKTTPFDEDGTYPGVELHATFIYNAINSDFISNISSMNNFYTVFAILLIGYFLYSRFKIGITVSVFIFYTIAIIFSIYFVFTGSDTFMNSGQLVFYNTTNFFGIMIYRYQTELKEKQQIRKAFSKYVSGSIVEEMLEHPDKLVIGGENKQVSALFTDIAGFTNLSEAVPPNVLTEFLKEYMTELTQVIIDNKGMLDKYIGDAIVALFGVPVKLDNHAMYACESALKMRDLSKKVSTEYGNSAFNNLVTRIGINTGNIVTGNMGSEQLFDYTGIGDNMNLAARLESLNKYYGTEIMISETTKKDIGDSFFTRELDTVAVKGKTKGVKVFELISTQTNIDKKRAKEVELYEDALSSYYLGNWKDAYDGFMKIKFDSASKILLSRCETFLENPPENWNGVWKMTSK